jgi:ATP-dependent Clp protease adaptor protein ClpS
MSTELALDEDVTIKFTLPKKYKVILLNDDHTPMEFVVQLLVNLFHKSDSEAEVITIAIHHEGKGIAGIYNYEVAEQKVHEATTISRTNGFPLSLKIEEE